MELAFCVSYMRVTGVAVVVVIVEGVQSFRIKYLIHRLELKESGDNQPKTKYYIP